jgi:protein gp37
MVDEYMADLFGDWDWDDGFGWLEREYVVNEVFNIVNQCPQHTFIFLTKNPKGMQGFDFPDNCWCGTSVENQEKADARIPELLRVKCKTLFVSYEPALGPVNFQHSLNLCVNTACMYRGKAFCKVSCEYYPQRNLNWLIIGAQTGPGAVKPHHTWISGAISQARNANIPVFVKDNVNWFSKIQEWPEGVKSC